MNPHEVEAACYLHKCVKTCVVFAVPSPLWGEQVGAAIVLAEKYTPQEELDLINDIKNKVLESGLERHKIPEVIKFVKEDQLLKTKSRKHIRIGLSDHLGLSNPNRDAQLHDMRTVSISESAIGVRFMLALAVMYVHIGEFDNRDRSDYLLENASQKQLEWGNTRSWCFHTPLFFMVGGFFLAAGTHSPIVNRKALWSFYSLRLGSLHPMYLVSILLCLVNFLSRCGPSNYNKEFERVQEPIDGQTFICGATPAEMPWLATLLSTLFTYGFALQSWLFFLPFSWYVKYFL